MRNIYLDHSATTPVDKQVLEAMLPYFSDIYGNASSLHSFGQKAVAGVDEARAQAAKLLNCKPVEVVFTSGATESNNLALRGIVKAMRETGIESPHIITSVIEHDAVLETVQDLKKEGVEVDFIPVDKQARVKPEDVLAKIKENTILVSIMHVNSEVGSVQPIREIAKGIKKINDKRENDWKKLGIKERGHKPGQIYFHTDATQAINFLNSDVDWNYVDMLSFSGHKIYGPKGIGALYIRTGVPLKAVQLGGHQEANKRSGTLNVSGIVGLGAAVSLIDKDKQEKINLQISSLRDKLISGIVKNIPNTIVNTSQENSSPSHAHFTFPGVEGESILMMLDFEGIAVSTGSACASMSLKASHVLLAMGIPKEIAHSSIRFTLGKYNTEEEIEKVIKVLPPIIEKLRKMSPVK